MSHARFEERAAGVPPPPSVRTACRFCGADIDGVALDLGMSPPSNSYLSASDLHRVEQFYPLRLRVCGRCLLVQLEDYVSPTQIFSDYAYFSSYSDVWLQHAEAFADAACDAFALSPNSYVIEIASNDGYLLRNFVGRGIPVLGIEPAANVAAEAVRKGVPTLVEFFGVPVARRVARDRQPDLLVANNVLAHVPDLNGFVAGLKILLHPQGVLSVEFSHVVNLVEENQFDTIYHEHFTYFSLDTVTAVLARHGLTVFDVEKIPTHGGSLRVYARHAENATRAVEDRVQSLLAAERAAGYATLERYQSFGEQAKEAKRQFLEFLISAARGGRSVVAYGAAAKGNTLLNYCGVRTDFIDYVVDRSPHKQGRFLPGTHIPIYHPDRIRETKPDFIVILPWNLKDEIMEQLAYVRSWGARFVLPVPRTEVLT